MAGLARHYVHHSLVPVEEWRWRYFSPQELASRGDGSLLVIPEAVDLLERLRLKVGRPCQINSAYRDPIYNARVGGAPRSRHKVGDAFDISLAGQDRHQLLRAAQELGFQGFGLYRSFLHLDLARPRQWYGRNAKSCWIS